MMNKKKIKKAAKAYDKKQQKICKKLEEERECPETIIFSVVYKCADAAFEDGINWFLDNLWHDVSEKPIEEKRLIVELKNGAYIYAYRLGNSYFILNRLGDEDEAIGIACSTRWFYINDLIK